jgi:hypothetical protein
VGSKRTRELGRDMLLAASIVESSVAKAHMGESALCVSVCVYILIRVGARTGGGAGSGSRVSRHSALGTPARRRLTIGRHEVKRQCTIRMVRAAQASPDSVLRSGAYGDFQKSESAPKGYTT